MEGLEYCWEGRVLSMEQLLGIGRALEGVEGRDDVERPDEVEGLAVDGERLLGLDGLI